MKWDQPRFSRRWSRIRALGIWKFTLLFGVLFWGGFMTLWMSVFATDESRLWINLIVFPVGGAAWGLAMWYLGERRYHAKPGT